MYRLLWQRLPGPPAVRTLLLLAGALAVGAVLVLVVFPAVERHLPIDEITLRT